MEKRFSKQRECVHGVLCSTKSHPDAEWVYGEAKRHMPSISLGTVYRNLGELVENGSAIVVRADDGKLHYDGDVSAHQHFVCSGCGRILDLSLESDMAEKVGALGHAVKSQETVFYGVCSECTRKKSS